MILVYIKKQNYQTNPYTIQKKQLEQPPPPPPPILEFNGLAFFGFGKKNGGTATANQTQF